jgi:hypothetical protein
VVKGRGGGGGEGAPVESGGYAARFLHVVKLEAHLSVKGGSATRRQQGAEKGLGRAHARVQGRLRG